MTTNTTEMVERVARAMLADELGPSKADQLEQRWEEESAIWLSNARAAIKAMRDPTKAMVEAGLYHGRRNMPLTDQYAAMIDAAFKGDTALSETGNLPLIGEEE